VSKRKAPTPTLEERAVKVEEAAKEYRLALHSYLNDTSAENRSRVSSAAIAHDRALLEQNVALEEEKKRSYDPEWVERIAEAAYDSDTHDPGSWKRLNSYSAQSMMERYRQYGRVAIDATKAYQAEKSA